MGQESRGAQPGAANNASMEAGSVKRARERVEADRGQDGLRSSPERPLKNTRPTAPVVASSISRPTPMPQWPLISGEAAPAAVDQTITNERPYAKGQAPQRPPRPSYVPSILDASKIQDHTPVFPSKQKGPPPTLANSWDQERDNLQPGAAYSMTPITPNSANSITSRPSTLSSVGTIPDFPIPTLPLLPPTRRSALGPPPTSRRGASSYYSQSSLVPPIIEEAEPTKHAHNADASRHVLSTGWDESPPDAYMEEVDEEEFEDLDPKPPPESDDTTGLVRKASMGKRFKPSLTTVKNGASDGEARSKMMAPTLESTRATQDAVARAVGMASSGGGSSHAALADHHAFLAPPSPADSNGSADLGPEAAAGPSLPKSMSEKQAAPTATVTPIHSPRAGRPPPLNLNAARPMDQRSSTTSLPDLIRRATRLASNLDRGRTASRLGMRDMLAATSASQTPPTKRTSISDMLASFPPPGLATPTTATRDGHAPRSPSPFADSTLVDARYLSPTKPEDCDSPHRRRNRRCCGLSLPVFVLLLIVLVLLVVAAIVVPIVLIAVPRINASNAAAAKAAALGSCSSTLPCANGGSSVVSSDSCRCVCAAGFTGIQCGVAVGAGCTTAPVDTFANATMGTAIPDLLGAAQGNFSVPLNGTALLAIFSATNLTCTSENALVDLVNAAGSTRRSLLLSPPDAALVPRADPVMTTAGIIYAASPTPSANAAASSSAPAVPTPNPSATALASPLPSTAPRPVTPHVLAFAKVAILYVLQAQGADPVAGVNAAILAQQQLQGALVGSTFAPGTLGLGGNATVDLAAGTVDAGMGAGTVGGVKF